jgi:peptidoglycan/xylan/chitin deacetylase (PgdA/CDA1 family)
MTTRDAYPRDLVGYGRNPPHARWPGGARIAVQFVLNVEEGGENNVLHGDPTSETFLSELGHRAGVREPAHDDGVDVRVRLARRRLADPARVRRAKLPLTIFGVAMALQRTPELLAAFMARGDEIASHGLRWIHYQNLPEATERRHLDIATQVLKELTGGQWPLGWYTGRDSPNTRRLVVEHGGYEYDSDYYGDDLPFWTEVEKNGGERVPHLVVPYSLDANDMRFVQAQGFNTGDHFFTYLRDSFDALYAEGDPAGPRPAEDDVDRHALAPARQARAGSARCSASSTTSAATTRSGWRGGSTSRATGRPSTPARRPAAAGGPGVA